MDGLGVPAVLVLVFIIAMMALVLATDFKTRAVSFFGWRSAPFIPTPRHAIPAIYAALSMTPASVLYELGCGSASVLSYCRAQRPEARYVGIERDPLPFLLARILRYPYLSERFAIRSADIFQTDLRPATRVFLYLTPPVLANLAGKLRHELPPRARIVSLDFPLPGWEPDEVRTIDPSARLGHTLYLYSLEANVLSRNPIAAAAS